MPTNDSASFPFRFIDVHAGAVRDRHREQFFEVPRSKTRFPTKLEEFVGMYPKLGTPPMEPGSMLLSRRDFSAMSLSASTLRSFRTPARTKNRRTPARSDSDLF